MAIPESIKQKANKIRNEVYGKDVREALASGIEEAGDIADQTRERQDSVEAQFQSVLDETTGKDVISAPEITAARVGADDTNHPNLKERLDYEHNELSSQLTQTEQEIQNLEESKASKEELINLDVKKADRVYVDEKFTKIGSAKPSGAFPTLSDLENAYPNGDGENYYVVTENNYWYYWNGNAWTAGGLFNATVSDDFRATNIVTNGDFETRVNWTSDYSENEAINNTLINTSDGSEIYASANYGFSDLIPGHKYYFKGKARVTNSDAKYLRIRATYTDENFYEVSNPVENEFYELSGIFTANANNSQLQFIHGYSDSTIANGKVMELQYVLGLDLTKIFGAGFEPSVEVMDKIMSKFLNRWFKGTVSPLFENSDLYKYVTELNEPIKDLSNLHQNGLVIKDGENSFIARYIIGKTGQTTVENGDGVNGYPTIGIPEGATHLFRPSVVSTSFGPELSPPLSEYVGDKATWDGVKWIIEPTGTISTQINVEAGKEYQIEMTFDDTNQYNTDVVPKFVASLGSAVSEKQFAGYSDALYKFTLTAQETGLVTLQLGDGIELWEAEITSVSVKEVLTKVSTAGRIGLGSFNIYTSGTNFALGGGHSERTSGVDNTGFGFLAQNNLTTGVGNNAFGARAQERLTIGNHNNALGYGAQRYLESGYYNIGIGYSAQSKIQDGSWNIGIGNEAQRDITSGNRNTTVGSRAHNSLTTGSWNVAMGREAGFNAGGSISRATTTGNKQTTIGAQSGQATQTQSDHVTALGYRALAAENATALGAFTRANATGSVAIGLDSEGTYAEANEVDEFVLGTENHHVKVKGKLNVAQYTPTSTEDTTGDVGDITSDDNYFYVKTKQGWKRTALETF